jgi:hypothetical protein
MKPREVVMVVAGQTATSTEISRTEIVKARTAEFKEKEKKLQRASKHVISIFCAEEAGMPSLYTPAQKTPPQRETKPLWRRLCGWYSLRRDGRAGGKYAYFAIGFVHQ